MFLGFARLFSFFVDFGFEEIFGLFDKDFSSSEEVKDNSWSSSMISEMLIELAFRAPLFFSISLT